MSPDFRVLGLDVGAVSVSAALLRSDGEIVHTARSPRYRVALRLHWNEALRAPAAAVGLEGRSDGLELSGSLDLTDTRWWAYGRLVARSTRGR